jgi:hypothetical protein
VNPYDSDTTSRDTISRGIFGVPAVLTTTERTVLTHNLMQLWYQTYGKAPADLDADLELCRRFFDPLARGHTLRNRLAQLPSTPKDVLPLGEPLVVVTGEQTLLVGIEARLVLALLEGHRAEDKHTVLPPTAVAAAERHALRIYRGWATSRLNQVIALRSGRGREVLQAISVGLIIALLVNRSDSPERAIVRWDHATPDGLDVDHAIHAGADGFAEVISGNRGNRSTGEQKLKGGYGLSEARRRLAHRLAVVPDRQTDGERVYVLREYREEVLAFLGRDLARRSTLTQATLETGFDQLVTKFRAVAGQLAHRSMVFERSGDTAALGCDLLGAFAEARRSAENTEK